jgi:hypothetical protein
MDAHHFVDLCAAELSCSTQTRIRAYPSSPVGHWTEFTNTDAFALATRAVNIVTAVKETRLVGAICRRRRSGERGIGEQQRS